MTIQTKLLNKILEYTKNNSIIWYRDPKRTIYRSYFLAEELKDLVWLELMINENYITLNVYPHEVEIPQYDKTKTFIRPNSIEKFEKYVQTNTTLFTFELDSDTFYGWIELLSIYHEIERQQYTINDIDIPDNLDNKKYYVRLKASVE